MIHFNSSRVLIPVDFSETSLLAIRHGAYLAQQTGAELFLLHVVNTPFMSQNMFLPTVNLEDQSVIEEKVMAKLAELGTQINGEFGVTAQSIIKNGTPAIEVSKVAKEIKASIIVMGTHGYSPIQEIMIGSVALKVITKSHCPVMVMRVEAADKGYKKIVLPIDDTVNSRQKVNYTLELAKKFNAEVHAIALLVSEEENDRPAMELVLHQIKTLADEKGVKCFGEVVGNVKNRATTTVNHINKIGGDMVVIMTDQDAELSGFFLGPYSQQIVHLSKVPVIAIKPQDIFIDDISYLPNTSGI